MWSGDQFGWRCCVPAGSVVTWTGVPNGQSATQILALSSFVRSGPASLFAAPLVKAILPFGPGMKVAEARPGTEARARGRSCRSGRDVGPSAVTLQQISRPL